MVMVFIVVGVLFGLMLIVVIVVVCVVIGWVMVGVICLYLVSSRVEVREVRRVRESFDM